jgi:hypothetical protein
MRETLSVVERVGGSWKGGESRQQPSQRLTHGPSGSRLCRCRCRTRPTGWDDRSHRRPYDDTFHVNPTASSTLDVNLAGTTGVCSVAAVTTGGFDVTMLSGTGTCTLTATRAGNDDYSAADPVSHDVARPGA